MRVLLSVAAMVALGLGALPSQARALGPGCRAEVAPVLGLAFQSRYLGSDSTRSQLNPEAEAAALAALDPVDTFITALTRVTDRDQADSTAAQRADCAIAQLADWARADALAVLGTETAALTVGSRLAGLAMVAHKVWPHATRSGPKAEVAAWLSRRVEDQMTFWERAPEGAAQGNLRLWSAVAAAAVGEMADDPVASGWAAWSATYVMCSADAGGALPQEMSRDHRALHYQLHAVAPLVTTVALLQRQGIALRERCDGALRRIVGFTLTEIENGGRGSMIRSGAAQTVFDGEGIKDFQLAWVEPWLSLTRDPHAEAVAAARRPLSYSKLGGNLTQAWSR